MGLKYTRDYKDINEELVGGIKLIDNFYEFFDMTSEDWTSISDDEQFEVIKTLADDVFFALGSEGEVTLGNGFIKYNSSEHLINIFINEKSIYFINLLDVIN